MTNKDSKDTPAPQATDDNAWKGKDIWPAIAGVTSLSFIVAYGAIRPAYFFFYGRFGLHPSDVGVTETEMVAGGVTLGAFTLLWILTTAGLLFYCFRIGERAGEKLAAKTTLRIPRMRRQSILRNPWVRRSRYLLAGAVAAALAWFAWRPIESGDYSDWIYGGSRDSFLSPPPPFVFAWCLMSMASGAIWWRAKSTWPLIQRNEGGILKFLAAVTILATINAFVHYTVRGWDESLDAASAFYEGDDFIPLGALLRFGSAPRVRVILLDQTDPIGVCQAKRVTLISRRGANSVVVIEKSNDAATYSYSIELPSDKYVVAVPGTFGTTSTVPAGICLSK